MKNITIGFLGGGNMATCLIGGLIAGNYDKQLIWVSDPDNMRLSRLKTDFGVHVSDDNQQITENTEVLVLAVKPPIVSKVVMEIGATIQTKHPLLVSIAAGIRESSLEAWCGGPISLVRCMPNTPALVLSGATALHANNNVTEDQRNIAESIMRAVGLTVWVDNEDLLDAVTALSGSGPAYFFLLMEAMERAAIDLGLNQEVARLLTQQTAFGAAKVALEVDESPTVLRQQVTSPGGTTEKAIEILETGGMRQLVANALIAAKERSIEISEELGEI